METVRQEAGQITEGADLWGNDVLCLRCVMFGVISILVWMVVACVTVSSALAVGTQLQVEQLRIQAAADGTYLEELAINTGNGSYSAMPEWVSLVTRGNGETLSRHFTVQGLDWNKDTLCWAGDEFGLEVSIMDRETGLELRKPLEAVPGQPWFKLSLEFINHSSSSLALGRGLGLQLGPGLGEYPVEGFGIADTLYSYVEAVTFSAEEGLQQFPFDEKTGHGMIEVDAPTWTGLQSRYLALLLMPEEQQTLECVRIFPGTGSPGLPQRYLPKVVVDLGIGTLTPGSKVERSYKIYAVPKSKTALTGNGHDFSSLLFSKLWQWMRSLSFALLWLLKFIHALIPSWGGAIIILAVCVRVLMYPLAQRSLKSQQAFMAVQKAMQPSLLEIKKNYKGGEQSERILQLYEQHGVSPLAGLKPLLMVLVQLPIFVALFNVLGQVFELRDASFLWIATLAEPDRLFALGFDIPVLGGYFNLLPVLMAVSTLAAIGLSSPPAKEGGGKRRRTWMLVLMAFVFFVLFYPFPAGMVLYWTMANVLHMMQQGVVGLTSKIKS